MQVWRPDVGEAVSRIAVQQPDIAGNASKIGGDHANIRNIQTAEGQRRNILEVVAERVQFLSTRRSAAAAQAQPARQEERPPMEPALDDSEDMDDDVPF